MAMRRNETRFAGWLVMLMALAGAILIGAILIAAPSAQAGTKVGAGTGHFNVGPHFGMHSRAGIHPRFGMALPQRFGIVPPLGPGIVPPLGPGIVPPLVSEPGRFDRRRFRQFPFSPFGFGFGSDIFIGGVPDPANLSAQMAAAPRLPPPQPDFEPHVISLKPNSAAAGGPRSVVVLRPGQPDQVLTFGDGAR